MVILPLCMTVDPTTEGAIRIQDQSEDLTAGDLGAAILAIGRLAPFHASGSRDRIDFETVN